MNDTSTHVTTVKSFNGVIPKVALSVFFVGVFFVYVFFQHRKTQYDPSTHVLDGSEVTVPLPALTYHYTDGVYDGDEASNAYALVQTRAIVENGQLTAIRFLQPTYGPENTRATTMKINDHALPILIREAITSQRADVDVVSGATGTSQAFQESLASALSQAHNEQ